MNGHVFLSHASPDKLPRVKSLVEALVRRNVKLWLDRPGHGTNCFGFSEQFIDAHDIKAIRIGKNYEEEIRKALADSCAVLACLSRSFVEDRTILLQELTVADFIGKLVCCTIEDIKQQPVRFFGFTPIEKLQAIRIDCEKIGEINSAEALSGSSPSLRQDLLDQASLVDRLVAELKRVASRQLPQPLDSNEFLLARMEVVAVPIPPPVRIAQIPAQVISAFANTFIESPVREAVFLAAMQLSRAAHSVEFEDEAVVVTRGEILPPQCAAEEFWGDALARAGLRSRRTLAAVLIYARKVRLDDTEYPRSPEWVRFEALLMHPNGH